MNNQSDNKDNHTPSFEEKELTDQEQRRSTRSNAISDIEEYWNPEQPAGIIPPSTSVQISQNQSVKNNDNAVTK